MRSRSEPPGRAGRGEAGRRRRGRPADDRDDQGPPGPSPSSSGSGPATRPKLRGRQQELARREQMLMWPPTCSHDTNSLLVLSIGALRVIDGHMSLGALVAFQSLMAELHRAGRESRRRSAPASGSARRLERLDDVLEHERDDIRGARRRCSEGRQPEPEAAPRRLAGELALTHVTFGYLPFSPPLVNELEPSHLAGRARCAGRRHRQRQVDDRASSSARLYRALGG